ncbi:MAG: alpha/beta fold hydrolase [Candidatus Gastranaerophilales bacterium]|nr:alpha/beta fold hydrolase [Candidatus Gastranaerophilales bacterium]
MLSLDIELIHERSPVSAVMLFHGLTGSPFELRKYAKFLYEEGYDVFCFCLPGHGSHEIDIYNVKYRDWTNFVSEKYRSLRGYYENFYVGGLCLGAVLALFLAQKFNTITGIICLSTTLYLDGWSVPKYDFLLPLGLNTIIKYYYTFMEREPFGIKNLFVRKKIARLMQNNTVALDNYPLSAIGELLTLSKKVRCSIKEINSPIIIFHSAEDDLTSRKSADFVYKNVSSVHRQKIILNNSYHLILYDNEKEYVYKKTIEFLSQTDGVKHFERKRMSVI